MVLVGDPNQTTTLLLVGRTGNGKSATGNSILDRKAFYSKSSSSGVTTMTLLQTATPPHLGGNHVIRVIDTPGLFEVLEGSESDSAGVKEIVRCAELAREGIHAILVVLTTRSRFSVEELAALGTLKALFGEEMANYMILVFTGGDDLEDDGDSLQDYLGQNCPHALKELLAMCGNRCISFDKRTKDEGKMQNQVKELLDLVGGVMRQNGGKPYKDEMFDALKRNSVNPEVGTYDLSICQKTALEKKLAESYDLQLKSIRETIELQLKEVTSKFEKLLADEKQSTAELFENVNLAAKKSLEETDSLKQERERSKNEAADLKNRLDNIPKCSIM